MVTNSIRVVYIMGYGRSGSTFLDILLGNHPQVVSGGELFNFNTWARIDGPCACRRPFSECEFWQGVASEYRRLQGPAAADAERVRLEVEARKSLPRLLFGRLPTRTVTAYRRAATALFQAIGVQSGAEVIVDSSKSAAAATGRVLALKRFTDFEVKAIFLVRDGRAVTWASIRRKGSPEWEWPTRFTSLLGLRALMGWAITNTLCMLLRRRLGADSVLLLRYEDLMTAPRGELTRVGEFIGLDLESVTAKLERGEPLSVAHTLAGNRLRFQEGVTLRPDVEWEGRLPRWYRVAYRLVAWPLLMLREPRADARRSAVGGAWRAAAPGSSQQA